MANDRIIMVHLREEFSAAARKLDWNSSPELQDLKRLADGFGVNLTPVPAQYEMDNALVAEGIELSMARTAVSRFGFCKAVEQVYVVPNADDGVRPLNKKM